MVATIYNMVGTKWETMAFVVTTKAFEMKE
jgi:hypothetical protein